MRLTLRCLSATDDQFCHRVTRPAQRHKVIQMLVEEPFVRDVVNVQISSGAASVTCPTMGAQNLVAA